MGNKRVPRFIENYTMKNHQPCTAFSIFPMRIREAQVITWTQLRPIISRLNWQDFSNIILLSVNIENRSVVQCATGKETTIGTDAKRNKNENRGK